MSLLSTQNKDRVITASDILNKDLLDVNIIGLASSYLCTNLPTMLTMHMGSTAAGERHGFVLRNIYWLVEKEGIDWMLSREGIEKFLLDKVRLIGKEKGRRWWVRTFIASRPFDSRDRCLSYNIRIQPNDSETFDSGLEFALPIVEGAEQLPCTHKLKDIKLRYRLTDGEMGTPWVITSYNIE